MTVSTTIPQAGPTRAQARRDAMMRLWIQFRRNRLGMAGAMVLMLLIVVAAFAPIFATHDPFAVSLANRLQPPSLTHFFGTDELGRDIYSRIVYGTRLTLIIVMLVVLTSAPVGFLIGITAGYFGGIVGVVLMRITDVLLAVPKLLMALAFVAVLGPGIVNVALAIALTAWPPYARLARAETLTLRNAEYVLAIRLAGASHLRVLLHHIMPMCTSSVIVRVTLDMAGIILIAAGLGFIGLGAQPPAPEWGSMISTGRKFIFDQWWVAAAPGMAIFVVSLSFNLVGDALRDVLDPKMRITQ